MLTSFLALSTGYNMWGNIESTIETNIISFFVHADTTFWWIDVELIHHQSCYSKDSYCGDSLFRMGFWIKYVKWPISSSWCHSKKYFLVSRQILFNLKHNCCSTPYGDWGFICPSLWMNKNYFAKILMWQKCTALSVGFQ